MFLSKVNFSWGVKNQWQQWFNQVPVILFRSGKYEFNVLKEHFMKEINLKEERNCSEDAFAATKQKN